MASNTRAQTEWKTPCRELSIRPGDNFDAAVRLVPKSLVCLRSLFEAYAVGDEERRIDFALHNQVQQRLEIPLHMGLACLQR